ncbi:26S proteasome non-ATPase regulatory subunit 5 [Triplophysa dalaica]|uniref:26S proteasome non-ATPase regulatory subunit 5 n=1 Tax=Triplophysa dalaica TaxID=1582913 RepID=UPI0024E03AC6|nr:26S proteasome non-ATPase regulatory subunit 5 [Triplophysa dalaica]
MAAPIERLLNEIRESEEPIEELKTLRTAVFATPASGLRETLSGPRLEVLFGLLSTNDKEQIEVCVEILGHVLQALEPVQLAQNYKTALHSGLNHPDDSVKILTLTQIGRVIGHADGATQMLNSSEILRDVIQCISIERIAVAEKAIAALRMLSNTKVGLDALFRSDLLNKLKDVMSTSDIIRYRVYELIVKVSAVSPVSLGYCVNSGLISQMLEELTGDDVLVRATAMEMITLLAESQHGRQYLAQQGIMDKISNMIIAAESDPLSSLYLPALVKFFGNLVIVDSPQQVCEKYPVFLEVVFSMAIKLDPTLTPIAVDTLGELGKTVEGKQVLHKTGEKFVSVLKRISKFVRDEATELRVRCLDTLAHLFTLPVEQQTDDLLLLTESWFTGLSSQPMAMIRNVSTQPFPELHCRALKIFTAIGCQPWGQRLMMDTPGFVEWVMDRSVGKGKEVKDCKFALVTSILSSSSTQEIFGAQNYLKLRIYVKEGPYYVHAMSTVCTEGAD